MQLLEVIHTDRLGAANPEQMAIEQFTEVLGRVDQFLFGEFNILYQFENPIVDGFQFLNDIEAVGDQFLNLRIE